MSHPDPLYVVWPNGDYCALSDYVPSEWPLSHYAVLPAASYDPTTGEPRFDPDLLSHNPWSEHQAA